MAEITIVLQERCPICHAESMDADTVKQPCGHSACSDCLELWLSDSRHYNCCYCRQGPYIYLPILHLTDKDGNNRRAQCPALVVKGQGVAFRLFTAGDGKITKYVYAYQACCYNAVTGSQEFYVSKSSGKNDVAETVDILMIAHARARLASGQFNFEKRDMLVRVISKAYKELAHNVKCQYGWDS